MSRRAEALSLSMPGLRATRWWSDELYGSMKEIFTLARLERGRLRWWGNGKLWESGPGDLQIKQPGDVHRDVEMEGPVVFQIITLPEALVARAMSGRGKALRVWPQLDERDERGAAFQRLHQAVARAADRLALEVATAEAVDALAKLDDAPHGPTRPVRRAMELLRERMTEQVLLDDLAEHAGLDKFHLCRAFRAQVGMPPHAYLLRLRIMRAKQLLASGQKASAVARQVGLYDQSQLTRHFRKIVGTTPARFARQA